MNNPILPLSFGSLFTGVGGLDLGLERAGLRCAWQVEIEPFPIRVLERHWPHVPRFRDVREVGAHNSRKYDLPPVDVLCGGFPCQDLSNAGKRAGLDGARSGLWKEYARLIEELQPSYVLIENVAALLQRNNRFDTVLRDLAARGFDACWSVQAAATFGAPHLRERIFVIAWRSSAQDWAAAIERWTDILSLADAGSGRRRTGAEPQLQENEHREEFARWAPDHALEFVQAVGRSYPGLPAHLRVDDGFAGELDESGRRQLGAARVKGCGNAVVPIVAEHMGACLVNWHQHQQKVNPLRL